MTPLHKVNLTAKMRRPRRKVSNREDFLADSQHGYQYFSVFLRVLGGLRGEKRFCSRLINTKRFFANS